MDVLQYNIYHAIPLPDGFDADLLLKMQLIQAFNLYYIYYGSELQKRVLNYPLFSFILSNFDMKADYENSDFNRKLIMLSAHDITIGQALVGLNLSSHECIFEVIKNNAKNNTENIIKNNNTENTFQNMCIS